MSRRGKKSGEESTTKNRRKEPHHNRCGERKEKEKDKDLVARAVDSVEEEIQFEPGTSLGLFPEIEKYLRRNRQNTYDEAVEALERYIRYYNDSRIHP